MGSLIALDDVHRCGAESVELRAKGERQDFAYVRVSGYVARMHRPGSSERE